MAMPRPVPVPTKGLSLLLCLPLALFGAGVAFPPLQRVAALADILILCACAADLAAALGSKPVVLAFSRRYAFPLGRPAVLEFEARNPGKGRRAVRVAADFPDDFAELAGIAAIDAGPGEPVAASFRFRPARRGEYSFPAVHARTRSPLGLFELQREEPAGFRVSVIPDIGAARGYLKAARANRSTESGLHPALRRGGESELDYLRDYRPDDDPRRIDWKASCRAQRPIAKVLRSETARNVMFLLDCGRLMTAEQGGLSSMDYAVNAVLMLSRVALGMGDAVGVLAFSGSIRGEAPLARGRKAIRGLSAFLSGIEPDYTESNYGQAFELAMRRLAKRSLVIVVSDMVDDLNAGTFAKYMGILSRRHLPLLVLLRDSTLEGWANSRMGAGEAPWSEYSRAAAREMALERDKAVSSLRSRSLAVLDLLPRQLSASMADAYLELKSRGKI